MSGVIKFKKESDVPSSPFTTLAQSVAFASNSIPKIKIETNEELTAKYQEIPFRELIWGPEESGKTHLLCTHPEPIFVIDTENRIPLIMPKFRTCKDCGKSWCTVDPHPKNKNKICGADTCPFCESKNTRLKDIRRILVNNSDLAIQARQMFVDMAKKHYETTGKFCTIGVDNIAKYWDWVQNEYAKAKGLEINEKTLDPRDDYKHINPKHNEEFRDIILLAPAHVVFIATAKQLYGNPDDRYKITGTGPEGQKHNKYAVDWEIATLQGEIANPIDGKMMGNGIFTAYVKKNSLAAARVDPIQFLTYDKLCEVRKKLLQACGVTFETPTITTPPTEEKGN